MMFIGLLSSCSIEKKLGKEYRETMVDSVALVMMPEYVFKNNLKGYQFPGIDTLSQWEKDSILLTNSIFLKEFSDTAIIQEFKKNFIARISEYDYLVLEEPNLDSFLVTHTNGILVNIAQISLEEFVHPYSFGYDLMDESLTVKDIDLNAVSLNLWIEVSRLNATDKNKVFFTSDFITDDLEGYFRQYLFTGKIEFEYTIDTLSLAEINEFIARMGVRSADYLYEYFLNRYIQENIPQNYPIEIKPLRWDPEKNIFEFKDPSDQFIELEDGVKR
jgi:hypothetical protein